MGSWLAAFVVGLVGRGKSTPTGWGLASLSFFLALGCRDFLTLTSRWIWRQRNSDSEYENFLGSQLKREYPRLVGLYSMNVSIGELFHIFCNWRALRGSCPSGLAQSTRTQKIKNLVNWKQPNSDKAQGLLSTCHTNQRKIGRLAMLSGGSLPSNGDSYTLPLGR